jgi:fibronectin type 3 domain-containing protein
MKKKSFQKAAACFLSVLMIVGLSPIPSFAAEFAVTNLVVDPVITPVITPIVTVPAVPSDFTGKLVHSSSKSAVAVHLEWTDNSLNESGFKIQRKGISETTFQTVATVKSSIESYEDTFNKSVGAVDYRICAYNSAGDSAYSSDIVTITYSFPTAALNLQAFAGAGPDVSLISLSWQEADPEAVDYYELYKKVSGGTYAIFATASALSFNDFAVEQGNTYYYKVNTVGYYGEFMSDEASTTVPVTVPKTPTNFSMTTLSGNSVKLVWNDTSYNEDGFSILWTLNGVAQTPFQAGENATSFTIMSLLDGSCTIKLKAFNSAGSSEYATQVLSFTVPLMEEEATDAAIDFDTASDWAVDEIQKAYDLDLTTDRVLKNFQKNITREEFCEIAVKLYEALSGKIAKAAIDNPFDDTTNTYVLKAFELGIVKGTSDTAFSPSNPITRQEICVMIYRTLKADDPSLNVGASSAAQFADQNQIASWAIDSVRFANENGIMKGTGGNKISPLNNTTREQAIVLLERTFESFE